MILSDNPLRLLPQTLRSGAHGMYDPNSYTGKLILWGNLIDILKMEKDGTYDKWVEDISKDTSFKA